MIHTLRSTDCYSCSTSSTSNFVREPNRLPTFIKTTFTALSPLAQKLYLRLCRSYIFPYISRADLLNRRFKSSRHTVEESWNCLLRFTSGHRSSLRPDSSSTPSLPPSLFLLLPPFCFPLSVLNFSHDSLWVMPSVSPSLFIFSLSQLAKVLHCSSATDDGGVLLLQFIFFSTIRMLLRFHIYHPLLDKNWEHLWDAFREWSHLWDDRSGHWPCLTKLGAMLCHCCVVHINHRELKLASYSLV